MLASLTSQWNEESNTMSALCLCFQLTQSLFIHTKRQGATINYNNHSTLFHNVFCCTIVPINFSCRKKMFHFISLPQNSSCVLLDPWNSMKIQYKYFFIYALVSVNVVLEFLNLRIVKLLKRLRIVTVNHFSECIMFGTLLPPPEASSKLQETLWVLVSFADFQDDLPDEHDNANEIDFRFYEKYIKRCEQLIFWLSVAGMYW